MNNPPIIIMGMHRSGTTMLAKILSQFGIFQGKKLEKNHESPFFIKINNWILSSTGSSWDNPSGFVNLFNDKEIYNIIKTRITGYLNSFFRAEYFGIKGIIQGINFNNYPNHWGWKDPRTTITLPLWLDIFPDIKIIHITRHGIDVASSLATREKQFIDLKINDNFSKINKNVSLFLPIIRGGILSSANCRDINRAFELWVEYLKFAKNWEHQYSDQILSVKYETVLESPAEMIGNILDFVSVDVNQTKLKHAISGINPNRSYAYKNNSNLIALSEKYDNILKQYGY